MKKIILMCLIGFAAWNAFAHELDGSISVNEAKKIAVTYASDQIFSEILDHDSSVQVISTNHDQSRFVFKIAAENCVVDVIVSTETGMAFNDDPMICKDEIPQNQEPTLGLGEKDVSIVPKKIYIDKAELMQVSDLASKADVLNGSKSFLVKIYYCGYDKVTSPRFQNLQITSKKTAILGGTMSTYIEKSMDLVVDVKQYNNVSNSGICYKVSQNFEMSCPIRPGLEGSGCQLTINGQYVIYIENFYNGVHTMLGYSANQK